MAIEQINAHTTCHQQQQNIFIIVFFFLGLVWFFIFIVHFIHFDWSKWLSICSIAESPVTSYEYDDDNFLEQYHQI